MGVRIISIVSSDPWGDQRVLRAARALHQAGAQVTVVGRHTPRFTTPPGDPFRIRRMRLWFNSGFLFYANLNLRLFFVLLFGRYTVILANDLDTLWPAVLISRWRRRQVVYDTHEYFTEMAELVERPRVQRFWKRLEDRLVPRVKTMYTVNDSIAGLYAKEYQKDVKVVRNIAQVPLLDWKSRQELGLPDDRFILILQGTGINIGRGGEQAVEAMQHVPGALLLVIGSGTAIPAIRQKVAALGLESVVWVKDPMPYNELLQYTHAADLGLALDMPSNLNYRYSLPNKLFDFIHCQTPVLSVDLPEIAALVRQYDCGVLLPDNQPEHLASAVNRLRTDTDAVARMQHGCAQAASNLTWDREKERLLAIFGLGEG
jgi:glycosyltransferase involved in cell wall biosynthesis